MDNNDLNSVIIDNLIDGIILIDNKGIIQRANRAALDIFGYEARELLGSNVSMLMPLPHSRAHNDYITNYIKTGIANIIGIGRDVKATRKDGSEFDMELAITHAPFDNEHYFIGFVRDISAQKEAEEMLKINSKIMRAINSALSSFINADVPKKEIFDSMLERLLDITESKYGFIGEILKKEDHTPYLKSHAITDISWNQETRNFYRENVRNGLEFYNLNTLFGVTIRTGEHVISNDPYHDERRGGLPAGHPALNTYIGVPIYSGNILIGMAGLANRHGGYNEELVYQLKPLLGTIGNLIAGYRNLSSRQKAEQDLYKAQQTLRNLAETDALTELRNRGALYLDLEKLFNAHQGKANTFSVLFLDIDHFKQINDTYGHAAGDYVLKEVANILSLSIRPDDVSGRYGGEEFVIGLPHCSASNAFELAERIREHITRHEFTVQDDKEYKAIDVTTSIGIASITEMTDSIEGLLSQADKAVYAAKQAGRNQSIIYDRHSKVA